MAKRSSRVRRHLRIGPAFLALLAAVVAGGCRTSGEDRTILTFSGSAVGREADAIRTQLARFAARHPDLTVQLRATPDASDDRRQLYVQWLNAHAAQPDVLQLDVIWTPEFAAAGWIRPFDDHALDLSDFFPAALDANRWEGQLFAVPWFVDVGMLYWRTDLMEAAPRTFAELISEARRSQRPDVRPYGFVWQGARYEGLVTVFLEHLGGFGGRILDERGSVAVDSEAGVRALTFMRDALWTEGVTPQAALTWQEEQTRFAFQNGRAVFMRNWPYAYTLLNDPAESQVAGRFAVAPMPSASDGAATAALGGSHLAINARSAHPDAALALVTFLTAPEQMLERARVVGQLPARRTLYDSAALDEALSIDLASARAIVDRARPRPVSPIYSQLSEILQIQLHRALTRQADPADALREAARDMRRAIDRAGLAG